MLGRREFIMDGGMAAAAAQAAVVKRRLPAVDLSFISKKMTLSRRSEWTDQEVKSWRMRGIGDVDRLTIHHTAGGQNTSTDKDYIVQSLRGVLAGHTDKGYGDIGYHFAVDYAGGVWEGRSMAYEGAHVQDHNERNIGIVLIGNFQVQAPSKEQVASMKQLVNVLRDQYRIKRHRLYGHRDLGSSACPGDNLYEYVGKLKEGKL